MTDFIKRLSQYEYIAAKHYSSRHEVPVDIAVIHYTAGKGNELNLAQFFANGKREASAHFGIGRKGDTIQMVDLDKMAWHAGPSAFDGILGVGRRSIGIELCNTGWAYTDRLSTEQRYIGEHRNPASTSKIWEEYTQQQIIALNTLLHELKNAIPTLKFITGHEDIRNKWVVKGIAGSKLDPGPAFPWQQLNLCDIALEQHHFSFQTKEWYTVKSGTNPHE